MDSSKIGQLIKELRKKHNLTQEQLADKVGVGFRAVSKWERGINTPELSNMYELCKIFNITKDELLSGKLNENKNNEDKSKKKITSKIVITISIITLFIITITPILIYQNNRTYTYKIVSDETETDYHVEGIAYFKNEKLSIILNEIKFRDSNFSNTIIQNYEYEITSDNQFIFGYGYIDVIDHIREPISIKEFIKKNKINFETPTKLTKESIIKNGMNLRLKFLTETNEIIIKDLTLELKPVK